MSRSGCKQAVEEEWCGSLRYSVFHIFLSLVKQIDVFRTKWCGHREWDLGVGRGYLPQKSIGGFDLCRQASKILALHRELRWYCLRRKFMIWAVMTYDKTVTQTLRSKMRLESHNERWKWSCWGLAHEIASATQLTEPEKSLLSYQKDQKDSKTEMVGGKDTWPGVKTIKGWNSGDLRRWQEKETFLFQDGKMTSYRQ